MNNRQLRETLVDVLNGVISGEIDPKTALATAKISDVILKSALSEAAYSRSQGDENPIDFFKVNGHRQPTIGVGRDVPLLNGEPKPKKKIIERTPPSVYFEYIIQIATSDLSSVAFTMESMSEAVAKKSGKKVSNYTLRNVLNGSEFTRFKKTGSGITVMRYYALNAWCEEVDGVVKIKTVHEPVALQHANYELDGPSDFTA